MSEGHLAGYTQCRIRLSQTLSETINSIVHQLLNYGIASIHRLAQSRAHQLSAGLQSKSRTLRSTVHYSDSSRTSVTTFTDSTFSKSARALSSSKDFTCARAACTSFLDSADLEASSSDTETKFSTLSTHVQKLSAPPTHRLLQLAHLLH